MSDPYRTGAYIKIDDSGEHAELRVVIADRETQGRVDADDLEAFVKVFTAALADMKKLRQRELTPPVNPHQFFVAAAGRK
jgi:tRNA/tmRNA/rRNA uracil-C5-methylase (TrmA/RlmC/RlmD family)